MREKKSLNTTLVGVQSLVPQVTSAKHTSKHKSKININTGMNY